MRNAQIMNNYFIIKINKENNENFDPNLQAPKECMKKIGSCDDGTESHPQQLVSFFYNLQTCVLYFKKHKYSYLKDTHKHKHMQSHIKIHLHTQHSLLHGSNYCIHSPSISYYTMNTVSCQIILYN